MITEYELLIRLMAGALAGLVIGYMRRRKAAGMRTFALLCLGCTAFTVMSFSEDLMHHNIDPSRVVAQIVTGIGFLGMGVIWHSRKIGGKPVGLTTAAAVWVTASVGILIGLGSWMAALVTAILTMAILYYREPEKLKK
jgi:putative Mg2+ transporter-C (MgtC) family protein